MTRIGLLMLVFVMAGCAPASTGAPAKPNPLPVVDEVRTLPGRGVAVQGRGSARVVEISPEPGGIALGILLLTLTHSGQSTFVVTAIQGTDAEVAARAVGTYRGRRPLVVHSSVAFEVVADSDWTLSLQPMPRGGQPAFSGTGDDVSAYFEPPPPATWSLSHSGQTAFVVYAHCLGSSVLVSDQVGQVQESTRVEFPRGPCFWEVQADGAWTLSPAP